MIARATALLAVVLPLATCDDMTKQPKAGAWSAASHTVHEASDSVAWQDKAEPPPPLTLALLQRGQQRFRIYCTPCHSELGDGNGMIVQRGFPRPPSYHAEPLLHAPVQHFYDVISNGYGAMYAHGDRIRPRDRWAIVAYVRALQLSQHAAVADMPPDVRKRMTTEKSP